MGTVARGARGSDALLHVVAVLAVTYACAPSTPDAGVAGSPDATEPCSSGPPYPDDATFRVEGAQQPDLPVCTARCGATAGGLHQAYSFDGLPSGSCSRSGAACQMAAQQRCSCPEAAGPLHEFVCTCRSGEWSCVITVQGGATCGACTEADGGDGGPV